MRTKDNAILAEFEFLVDLDLALFKYIKTNFYHTEYVNRSILRMSDESEIIDTMLYRKEHNPLDILFNDSVTTDRLYGQLINIPKNYAEILKFAKVYDTFPLLITMLNNASSLEAYVLCRDTMESDFIHSLNSNVSTIIEPNKSNIDLTDYTVLWVKYFDSLLQYNRLRGNKI